MVRDLPKPELLDEPILKRLMRSLHPALGSWAVGANDVNVQIEHRAPDCV
jgi:hypothetical protein